MFEDYFYKRLSQLRLSKNVSAREMSLAMGQNENYINRIENQKAYPSMQGFFYICEYLGVTPSEFFNADNSDPLLLKQLYEACRGMDYDDISALIAVAKRINKK